MQIKKKILKTNSSKFIRIGLNSSNDLLGFDNMINSVDIDKYIEKPKNGEIVRYGYNNVEGELSQTLSLNFNFSCVGEEGTSNLVCAGFTEEEILLKSTPILNSFFILDVYDSLEPHNRRKILSNYLTKVTSTKELYLSQDNKMPNTTYALHSKNQLYYLNIPKHFISDNNEENHIKLYGEFSFYSGKTGKIHRFVKSPNSTTKENHVVEISLNVADKTWRFNDYQNSLNLYSISLDSIYSTKVNNTIKNKEVKSQVYPIGDTFDILDATYKNE